MRLRRPLTAVLAAALSMSAAVSASAQESCSDLYNRTIATYQTYGPESAVYAQLYRYYLWTCASSPALPQATPYYYTQPTPLDPNAALWGGIIGGAIIGGALSRGYRHRGYPYRGGVYRGGGFHGGGFHGGGINRGGGHPRGGGGGRHR